MDDISGLYKRIFLRPTPSFQLLLKFKQTHITCLPFGLPTDMLELVVVCELYLKLFRNKAAINYILSSVQVE